MSAHLPTEQKKVTEIAVKFEDGSLRRLTGEAATRWVKLINSNLAMWQFRGGKLPDGV